MNEKNELTNHILQVLQEMSVRQEQHEMAIVNMSREISALKDKIEALDLRQKETSETSCGN